MSPGLENLDPSMLELFKVEAENHSRTLSQGLVEMEAAGGDAGAITELMRAAHSIKGAARIVGLDRAVGLAHAMEDVLTAAQAGKLALTGAHIDVLLKGTDVFEELSRLDGPDMPAWLEREQARMDDLAAVLRGEKPLPEQGGRPKPESAPAKAPEPEAPAEKAPAGEQPAPEAAPDLDPSMLELFKVEAENHSRALSQGLLAMEESGPDQERLRELMRAAHSIKGAARIVGLDRAVGLAHAMEDVLTAAQAGKADLGGGTMDLLLKGTDVFEDLSGLDVADMPGWLAREHPRLLELTAALRGEGPAEAPAAKPGAPAAPDQAPARAEPASPPPAADQAREAGESEPRDAMADSVVRVSAGNLSRILSLSGECMVEAARLGPFLTSLLQLKNTQRELIAQMERLGETACEQINDEKALARFRDLQNLGQECVKLLAGHMERFEIYSRRSDVLHNRLHGAVQASRMRPFQDGAHGFPRLVRDLARDLGRKIKFTIKGKFTKVDRDILEKLEAPLTHLLRNAVDHGIEDPEERLAEGKDETGTITLWARHRAGMLAISITDDGRGLDPERIRTKVVERGLATADMAAKMNRAELMEFLFLPGFSTARSVTEISGRGVGLDVVHAMVKEVGGTVRASSQPGKGMDFNLQLPLTLSVLSTLIVMVGGEPFAVPLTRIDHVDSLEPHRVELIEDRQYASFDGVNVGLVNAAQLLEMPQAPQEEDEIRVIVVSDRMSRYGLVVDGFLGEQDLVVRPLDPRLGKVPDVMAAARMADGSPVLILDIEDVVRNVDNMLTGQRLRKSGKGRSHGDEVEGKRILVVDDSLTVREVERKLLENNGYVVDTAVDGMDGLNKSLAGGYDLVVTDVDMPRMDGIALVQKLKSDPNLKHIPVMIVSYKDREEDRMRGLEAGADYYLTKSSFHDETLLTAVADLIGGD